MSRHKNHNLDLTFTFVDPNSNGEFCSLLREIVVEKILTEVSRQRKNTTLNN